MITAFTEIANRQSVVEVLLRSYKRWISPLFSHACRFTPTCSEYAAQAVMERGWWCGGVLAIRRLLGCHPLGPSGYDPLPEDSDSEQLRP